MKIVSVVLVTLMWVVSNCNVVYSQDDIPEAHGFSGYFILGSGYFNGKSNLLASGPPLLEDLGDANVNSIFDSPQYNSGPILLAAGELNYKIENSRTQFFLGTRMEDLLRLDVVFGLGIRQELCDSSIIAFSVLTTPLSRNFWKDPYVEGKDRIKTEMRIPGLRLRWGRIFKTGLELTTTYRRMNFNDEMSGTWLAEQGRLNPIQQQLLVRDGNILKTKLLYRIDIKRHRFEPAFRYTLNAHEGDALKNKGYAALATYLYRTNKIILDANLFYGSRSTDIDHPVYNQVLESGGYGAAFSTIIPIKINESSVLSLFVSGEFFQEHVNVDFFDGQIGLVLIGIVWRNRTV